MGILVGNPHTKILTSFLFLGLAFILYSCKKDSIISESDVASDPDKALSVLMSMDASQLHSRREQADYALFLSMALDKNYIDISSDTLIAPAVRFYQHHRPKRNQMLTAYYQGRVCFNMGNVHDAVYAFERAAEMAGELRDDFYLGLIYRNFSMLYEYSYDTDMTVSYIRKSVDAFHRARAPLYERYERMALATALGNNREHAASCALFDSLLYQGGLDSLQLSELYPAYARELIMADLEPEKALVYYGKGDSSIYSATDFGAWALLHLQSGHRESADNLLRTAQWHIQDDADKAALDYFRYRCAQLNGYTEESLGHLEQSTESQNRILREKMKQSVSHARQEYTARSLEEKESRIYRQRGIALFGAGILLAGFLVFMHRRRKELRDTMAQMEAIQESLSNAMDKNELLAASVMKNQVDALQLLSEEYEQSTRLDRQGVSSQKFRKQLEELRNQGSDLTMLEASVNEYREGAMKLFREDFPGQSKLYYSRAAMFFAGFPYDLMSLLTKTSITTLKTWKSLLRKAIIRSESSHKSFYLSLLNSAERKPVGRPKKSSEYVSE